MPSEVRLNGRSCDEDAREKTKDEFWSSSSARKNATTESGGRFSTTKSRSVDGWVKRGGEVLTSTIMMRTKRKDGGEAEEEEEEDEEEEEEEEEGEEEEKFELLASTTSH